MKKLNVLILKVALLAFSPIVVLFFAIAIGRKVLIKEVYDFLYLFLFVGLPIAIISFIFIKKRMKRSLFLLLLLYYLIAFIFIFIVLYGKFIIGSIFG